MVNYTMRKFRREFNNVTIDIFVETALYESETILFETLFKTFSTSIEESVQEKTEISCAIYRKESYKSAIFNHVIECDIREDKWIFLLMNDLEKFYIAALCGTVLHASCIKVRNKVLMLIGERHTGKTTLTRYLIEKQDGEYLNDDCVYIVDKTYVGFGMPLPVRWDGNTKFNNKGFLSKTVDTDGVVRILYKPCKIAKFYNEIDAVIFPRYNFNGRSFVERMSKFEAYKHIVNNVRSYKEMKSMFMDIHDLTRNAECYRIVYAHSEAAYEMLCAEVI